MPLDPIPAAPSRAHDLSDAEFAELDELLRQTPEPLEPLDAVMLDGFLCGVIVQPVLLQPATWLAHVFDFDGRPLPDPVDPAWLQRTTALILRHHAALNRAIVEDGWFDPVVMEPDDDAPITQDEASGHTADDASPSPEAAVSKVSQPLLPWVAGFQRAVETFPDLAEIDDDAVMAALARLYRHLPAETDEEREIVTTLDREFPLATLDDALEELVAAVADLQDLTHDDRYRVETVTRESPKVGRNDPCPCGSGKKFKQCHGAS